MSAMELDSWFFFLKHLHIYTFRDTYRCVYLHDLSICFLFYPLIGTRSSSSFHRQDPLVGTKISG